MVFVNIQNICQKTDRDYKYSSSIVPKSGYFTQFLKKILRLSHPNPPPQSIACHCWSDISLGQQAYGQMYMDKQALQQRSIPSAGNGRSWSTQVNLNEYVNNTFTCTTSEQQYWEHCHESKSCTFNMEYIENAAEKLQTCQHQLRASRSNAKYFKRQVDRYKRHHCFSPRGCWCLVYIHLTLVFLGFALEREIIISNKSVLLC